MTRPIITRLDDVLPHIAGRDEFVHAMRDGYSVIDYNFALADSFDDPVRLECRGIKFAPDGTILARPLHKFFNIGERADTQSHLLPFHEMHDVTEKMDGSMIHPANVDGDLVFMTRMGRTDHARMAERHITEDVEDVCRGLLHYGATPIFEWTAPDNRIVVRYPESRLTLLAIRETEDGHYFEQNYIEQMANDMGVAAVPVHTAPRSSTEFLAHARAVTGMEGFVVRFANGLWVKAKGEDYVLKHKAKDSILQEKNLLALVLRGELDDVLPLLDEADRSAAELYRDQVTAGVGATAANVAGFVAANDNLDQKAFAVSAIPTLPVPQRSIAFMVRKGVPATEAVRQTLERATGSQTTVDETRHLHGAVWAA